MDIIIKNAKIVDGTGNPFYYGDIGISGDRISVIGRIVTPEGGRILDVERMVVCPGFIDEHSHSDWTIQQNRQAESSLRQGVTTEIVGNCGFSNTPVTEKNENYVKSMLDAYQPDVSLTWNSFQEYLFSIEHPGIGINMVFLVGHGNLRRAVLGAEARPATDEEIKEIKELLSVSLDEGAAGLSTGLEFMPGRLADKRELIAFLDVVAHKGKVHACHIRNRDRFFKEAIDEIIEVTQATGVRLVFSHLSAKPGSDKDDWQKIMDKIEAKRKEGFDVTADMIPYRVGPGILSNILPDWMFEGGVDKLVKRLNDKEIRKKLLGDCNCYWLLFARGEWEKISLSGNIEHPEFLGKNFKEISEITGKPPLECVFDILADAGKGLNYVTINGVLFTEEHVREMISHPLYAIVSDGWSSGEHGPTSRFANHPNCFGWVPRVLGYYVREVKLFRLEDAIKKMTSFPATRFNLKDRGILKEGMIADIAVFDEHMIAEEVSYVVPKKYANCMKYVFLSGKIVVENGKLKNKGMLSGKILK